MDGGEGLHGVGGVLRLRSLEQGGCGSRAFGCIAPLAWDVWRRGAWGLWCKWPGVPDKTDHLKVEEFCKLLGGGRVGGGGGGGLGWRAGGGVGGHKQPMAGDS